MDEIQPKNRLRDLGISIGIFPTGPYNAITDVPGVLVGHTTVIQETPSVARTGVTAIVPNNGQLQENAPFAGYFSFNGIGEMTGLLLIDEWGILTSPIILTNTNQVGMAREALVRYGVQKYGGFAFKLPVVAETYDGVLNDIDSFPLTESHVVAAIENAASGPVAEGNVGGGTGMICYDFKGGIGTSSRVVQLGEKSYTIGTLVQANHGSRHMLQMNGIPVGKILNLERIPGPQENDQSTVSAADSSSILVIIATDAPLLPDQCRRLAKRATVGLARTGGVGYNTSGDIFLAFATGNTYEPGEDGIIPLKMLHQRWMNPLIEATAEAVEEAILNVLVAAETMIGYQGSVVHSLPVEELKKIFKTT
jgi:D-aminopeptidase